MCKQKLVLAIGFLALTLSATQSFGKTSEANSMNWSGLEKFHIPLAYPLLIIKGSKGFLSCAYISADVCTNKTKEACAIVTGVKTHDDMLQSKIIAVSEKAKALGIHEGMTGKDALELFK